MFPSIDLVLLPGYILFGVIGLIAGVSNSIIAACLIIQRWSATAEASFFYILLLQSIADAVYMFATMIDMIIVIAYGSIPNEMFCMQNGFITYFCAGFSLLSLTVFSYERKHSVKHSGTKLPVLWFYIIAGVPGAIFVGLTPILFFNKYVTQPGDYGCAADWFDIGFSIFCAAMIVIFVTIQASQYYQIWDHSMEIFKFSKNTLIQNNDNLALTELRVTFSLILALTNCLLGYTPFVFFSILYLFAGLNPVPWHILFISLTISMYCLLNAFLYGYTNPMVISVIDRTFPSIKEWRAKSGLYERLLQASAGVSGTPRRRAMSISNRTDRSNFTPKHLRTPSDSQLAIIKTSSQNDIDSVENSTTGAVLPDNSLVENHLEKPRIFFP